MKAVLSLADLLGDVEFVVVDGERWVKAEDIGQALGLSAARHSIHRIYYRHRDEFSEGTQRLLDLPTRRGPEMPVRVFSERGCAVLAMITTTPNAKAFRRWLMDCAFRRAGGHA